MLNDLFYCVFSGVSQMMIGKIALLGAVLALATPAVLADTITFTGTEGGSGITTTGFTLVNITSGPHKNSSLGAVGSQHSGWIFDEFTTGNVGYFPITVAGSSTAAYSTPSAFKYASGVGGTTFPFLLFTTTENGHTLNVYVNSVGAHSSGTVSTKGSLTLNGYITLDGGKKLPVTVSVLNDTVGTGAKAFTATITGNFAPEPGSLALLGTGVLGIANLVRRRRRMGVKA